MNSGRLNSQPLQTVEVSMTVHLGFSIGLDLFSWGIVFPGICSSLIISNFLHLLTHTVSRDTVMTSTPMTRATVTESVTAAKLSLLISSSSRMLLIVAWKFAHLFRFELRQTTYDA